MKWSNKYQHKAFLDRWGHGRSAVICRCSYRTSISSRIVVISSSVTDTFNLFHSCFQYIYIYSCSFPHYVTYFTFQHYVNHPICFVLIRLLMCSKTGIVLYIMFANPVCIATPNVEMAFVELLEV